MYQDEFSFKIQNNSDFIKTEETWWEKHNDKLKLFCFNWTKPIWVMWSHYENEHEGHRVKPIPIAIDLAWAEKRQLVDEGTEIVNILSNSISQYQQLQETMTKQKFLYLK